MMLHADPESWATPVLRRLRALGPLTADAATALELVIGDRVRRTAMQEDLLREGEAPEVMRAILSGWACRYKVLEDGRRQIINFLFPGDICDLRIFMFSAMDHSIGAITPVTYGEISPADLDRLTRAHPTLDEAFWRETLVQSALQREWTVNLGQRVAYERIAHLLCEIFTRLSCVGLTRDGTCSFPLTQNDLADATGLSAVHVNRTLQELRAADLILLRNRSLTIRNFEALQTAGLFNPNYLHMDANCGPFT